MKSLQKISNKYNTSNSYSLLLPFILDKKPYDHVTILLEENNFTDCIIIFCSFSEIDHR